MQLVVSFYRSGGHDVEILECLRVNTKHFDHVHVLMQDPLLEDIEGVVKVKYVGDRVSIGDLVGYANYYLKGRVVVGNSDIMYDESIRFLDEFDMTGKMACLTRWEGPVYSYQAIKDAWMFDVPLRRFRSDFRLGEPGAEFHFELEAMRAGIKLVDPSSKIKALHIHKNHPGYRWVTGDLEWYLSGIQNQIEYEVIS